MTESNEKIFRGQLHFNFSFYWQNLDWSHLIPKLSRFHQSIPYIIKHCIHVHCPSNFNRGIACPWIAWIPTVIDQKSVQGNTCIEQDYLKKMLMCSYFFSPWSISVWPTQMPWVSTLTTPFLYVKRSGRTNATKLTGSWRKIPETNICRRFIQM